MIYCHGKMKLTPLQISTALLALSCFVLLGVGCDSAKSENEKLKEEITDVNSENEKLRRELETLKGENSKMHMRVAQLHLEIASLHNEIQAMQKDLNRLKEGEKKR